LRNKRYERLTPAELAAVEADIEATRAHFERVLDQINGRVPARTIDRWLKVEKSLHSFAVVGLDEMRA
jgi:hypothetical protein